MKNGSPSVLSGDRAHHRAVAVVNSTWRLTHVWAFVAARRPSFAAETSRLVGAVEPVAINVQSGEIFMSAISCVARRCLRKGPVPIVFLFDCRLVASSV